MVVFSFKDCVETKCCYGYFICGDDDVDTCDIQKVVDLAKKELLGDDYTVDDIVERLIETFPNSNYLNGEHTIFV